MDTRGTAAADRGSAVMHALVWTAPYEASVEEVERPHPGAGEVELKVLDGSTIRYQPG